MTAYTPGEELREGVRTERWRAHWRNMAQERLAAVDEGVVDEMVADNRLIVALIDEIESRH